MIPSRQSALLIAALAASGMLQPSRAHAQWFSARVPADFEECADAAEKSATREAKTAALSACNAKFAGRRRPGGGYTYFDFMQDRTFDIAGPNPTPREQKHIDEQYTGYLDRQRQSTIASVSAAKRLQQAVPSENDKPSQTTGSAGKPPAVASDPRPPAVASDPRPPAVASDPRPPRLKVSNCARDAFSCEWPRLSEGIKDLKKLFGATQGKAKRG